MSLRYVHKILNNKMFDIIREDYGNDFLKTLVFYLFVDFQMKFFHILLTQKQDVSNRQSLLTYLFYIIISLKLS